MGPNCNELESFSLDSKDSFQSAQSCEESSRSLPTALHSVGRLQYRPSHPSDVAVLAQSILTATATQIGDIRTPQINEGVVPTHAPTHEASYTTFKHLFT